MLQKLRVKFKLWLEIPKTFGRRKTTSRIIMSHCAKVPGNIFCKGFSLYILVTSAFPIDYYHSLSRRQDGCATRLLDPGAARWRLHVMKVVMNLVMKVVMKRRYRYKPVDDEALSQSEVPQNPSDFVCSGSSCGFFARYKRTLCLSLLEPRTRTTRLDRLEMHGPEACSRPATNIGEF